MSVDSAFVVFCDAEDCNDRQFSTASSMSAALRDVGYERRDGRDLCPFCQDRQLCDACRAPLTAGRCTWRACDLYLGRVTT